MKLFVFITILLLQWPFVKAQNVVWTKVSDDRIEDVCKMAAEENKKLFFFFYVDWDEQAMFMMDEIFTQKEVAGLYNASFVNVPFNLGEGQGGPLVKRYGIRGTPALVFVDEKQKLLKVANNRALASTRAVMKAARLALGDPNEKEWSYYKQIYDAGNRDWQFLEKYISERSLATMLPAPYDLILEYVSAVPESIRYQNKNVRLQILNKATPGNELYDLLKVHHSYFPEWQSKGERIAHLTHMIMKSQASSFVDVRQVKESLKADFGQDSYPALEYFEILRMLEGNESPAFIDAYFDFIKSEDLPSTYYGNILNIVIRQGHVKKEYAELILRDLSGFFDNSHNSYYTDAALTFLLINANRKKEAVLFARSLIDKLKYNPRNELENRAIVYLRNVARGVSTDAADFFEYDY